MPGVLIVDGDPDVIHLCRVVLEESGFNVHGARSRMAAVEAVRIYRPDLIILDIMLEEPDDGLVIASELRREGILTPIMVMSNWNRIMGFPWDLQAIETLVDDVQEKPLEPGRLLERVRTLIGPLRLP
ncbi:MAG: response regulator [Acidobacteriota bacterium]|jgi:DNA-binding response OmpR family regulator